LQLNKEQFATFFDISRSALAAYEKGDRLLPTNASLKISAIELALNNTSTSLVKAELQEQKNSLQNDTQQQKNLNILNVKQKQLNALQNEYSKDLQLQQVVRLLQQTPNNSKNKKDILWLAAIEAMAVEK
jgi:transcriptional regulator with XRE-family HTH domain